jgi:hypothetical protein
MSEKQASLNDATDGQHRGRRGRQQHRQTTRWRIYFPFFLSLLLVIGLFVVVALLPRRIQVSLVSDWLFIIFVLCPMILCLFPLVLGVVAAVYGANRLHDSASPPLERLEELSASMNERVVTMTDKANQRVVDANAKVAPWLRWASFFDADKPVTGPSPSTNPPVKDDNDLKQTADDKTPKQE